MDGGSWHCTEGRDQDHPQEKEMQKGKMVVWGGLTNRCENSEYLLENAFWIIHSKLIHSEIKCKIVKKHDSNKYII